MDLRVTIFGNASETTNWCQLSMRSVRSLGSGSAASDPGKAVLEEGLLGGVGGEVEGAPVSGACLVG